MAENTTKDFIIQTANQLFLERGYPNVTIQDICEACGITKTTFYYHLKSKEDLIINNYDPITSNLTSLLLSMVTVDNYWEKLMLCFEALVQESMKYGPDLYSQLFIANLKEDRGSFDFRDHLTEAAVAIIAQAQKAGQIRNPNPPDQLYKTSAYLFTGYEIIWCIKKGNFDWKKEIRRSMELFFDTAPELRIKS